MKRKIIYILLIWSLPISNCVKAQCNIKMVDNDLTFTYASNCEKVYINEDLENGFNSYHMGINAEVSKITNKPRFYLTVNYANYKLAELKPRNISIEFNNGYKLNLFAETEKNLALDKGVRGSSFFYNVSNNIDELINSPISQVTFIDSRTGYGIPTKIYPKLLSEMIGCIVKKTPEIEGKLSDVLRNGVRYNIYFDVPGIKKIVEDSYVILNIRTTIADSVIFDSYDSNNGQPIEKQLSTEFLGAFMEGFKLLSAGDCATFQVPVEMAFEGDLPPFAKPGDMVGYYVKIFSVRTKEEFENDRK